MDTKTMESVRPIPKPIPPVLEVPLTEIQKSVLQGKKRAMKDILVIQSIYGKLDEKNELPREVRRFLQRRNEYGLVAITSHPFQDDVMEWNPDAKTFNPEEENDNETYIWVADNTTFWYLMADINKSRVIWVDLEANEWDGFTGITCLIQISTVSNNYIVDCFAIPQEIQAKLKSALESRNIIKVMHGSSNDLRWLQRDFGIFLWPLIDTQILEESFFGTNQVSFASLVQKYLNIIIPKEEKVLGHFSDYRNRPLHPNLIRYAVRDTYLLRKVWGKMLVKIGVGLTDANEMFLNCKKHLITSLFGGITLRGSDVPGLNDVQMELYTKLTDSRQRFCVKMNLPIQRVATDAILISAVRNNKAPYNVHPAFRKMLKDGWKDGSFSETGTTKPSEEVACMKCGAKNHVARNCNANGKDKAKNRKEFYESNPEAKLREKQRLREKRRKKRQVTGETHAWFQNKRGDKNRHS